MINRLAYIPSIILMIMCFGFVSNAHAQHQVMGAVTEAESDEPLAGVNIRVQGTTIGTSTGADGTYELTAPSPTDTLVFSFIGFKTQNVPINERSQIDINMASEVLIGEDVVVVGYGTQQEGDVTASISSVKSEEFTEGAVFDAGELIQGKVAGLNVITPSGNPLANSQISLRGVTTLSSGSNPLILIDGVPGSLNSVAPSDIKQIDVLKDGSAAAIYGTRGTNGVILITTNRGSGPVEPSIRLRSSVSTQQVVRRLPMMTPEQYRDKVDRGLPGAIDNGASVDWLDEILQTPFTQNHSINFEGGTSDTRYDASLEYLSNEGIVRRSRNQVLYPSLNVFHNMFDNKLEIQASAGGSVRQYDIPYNDGVYQGAIVYNPTTPIRDEDGNWTESARDLYENPLALLNETRGNNNLTNLRLSSVVDFNPIEKLQIKFMASRVTNDHFAGYYETKQHRSTTIQGRNGYASRSESRTRNTLVELTSEYNDTFLDAHNVTGLVGYTWNNVNFQNAFMDNFDFPTDDFTFNNIGTGAALQRGAANQSTTQTESQLIGYFGRLNYNFKNKYYISGSIRYEGSSKFGADHKWGTFPGVNVGWNLKSESFLQDVDFLSSLKLRGGFGITGTAPGDSYLSLRTLSLSGFYYYGGQWINQLAPDSNPNPNLRWERKKETNIGLDYGFYDERISGSIDVYNRDTEDLIFNYTVPVPPYLSSEITANAGSIRNRGIEVAINTIPVQQQNFRWGSNIVFSANQSELTALSSGDFVSGGFRDLGNTLAPIQQTTHRIEEGEPIGNFFGYKSIGIDEDGHWIIEGADGNPKPISEQQPQDKQVIGNGLPDAYLNWTNSFNYKAIDFSVIMRGAFGFDILNMPEMNYAVPIALGSGNVMDKAFDDVYGERPLANDQSLQYVSYYVQNGDYWKIDRVTLGYSPMLNSQWLKSLRVYGSVRNLAIITSYPGVDPEVNVQGLTPGVDDRYRYPSSRIFTVGVDVNF